MAKATFEFKKVDDVLPKAGQWVLAIHVDNGDIQVVQFNDRFRSYELECLEEFTHWAEIEGPMSSAFREWPSF